MIKETLSSWLPALLKSAEQGDPDSMGIIGFMYTEGFGVEKDIVKGRYWLDREKHTPPLSDEEEERLDEQNPWLGKTAEEV